MPSPSRPCIELRPQLYTAESAPASVRDTVHQSEIREQLGEAIRRTSYSCSIAVTCSYPFDALVFKRIDSPRLFRPNEGLAQTQCTIACRVDRALI